MNAHTKLRPGRAKEATAQCKAFSKHSLDGHVFQEKRSRGVVWVAYLTCSNCGTLRVDVMTPNTCQLLSRSYERPDDYDTKMTVAEAKRIVFTQRLVLG